MVHNKWVLLLPLTVLVMGCSAQKSVTKPIANSSESQYGKFNGLTLDVARRHYKVATLTKYIQLVGAHHGRFIQLHLTDDKNFAIENNFVGQTTHNAVKKDGVWHNKHTNQFFYSKAEIKYLIRDAKKYNVTLIPEIDTPAHVTGLVNTLKANGHKPIADQISWHSSSYGDELHLNNTSIHFVEKLDNEVAADFAGQQNLRFHLGGDEFTDKVAKNPAYIKYLNATSQNIQQQGFIPEAWNDGFLSQSLNDLNHHIQVTYWNWTADQHGELGKKRKKYWASMPNLVEHGFKVFNYNDYYLYFNVSKANMTKQSVAYMTKDMKQYWTPALWHEDHATKVKSLKGIVGSSASIWADDAGSISDNRIYHASDKFITSFLALAQKPL